MNAETETKVKAPKNPFRISLRTLMDEYGHEDAMEFLEEICSDSIVPALCKEGCEVEPDGRCSHGCPSPLVAAGII